MSEPRLIVIRSFDVNKPGEDAENLKGGVAGGSILQGVLRVGDEIEVRPGIVSKDSSGRVRCTPIFSKIVALRAEKNMLEYAVPGGLIGVGTKIDPMLTRADRLVGQVSTWCGCLWCVVWCATGGFPVMSKQLSLTETIMRSVTP